MEEQETMAAIKGTAIRVGTIYMQASQVDRACAELRAVVDKRTLDYVRCTETDSD